MLLSKPAAEAARPPMVMGGTLGLAGVPHGRGFRCSFVAAGANCSDSGFERSIVESTSRIGGLRSDAEDELILTYVVEGFRSDASLLP